MTMHAKERVSNRWLIATMCTVLQLCLGTVYAWSYFQPLLVERFRNGKKVPPALQRFRADDLLTAVFPKLTGCQENVTGDLEVNVGVFRE